MSTTVNVFLLLFYLISDVIMSRLVSLPDITHLPHRGQDVGQMINTKNAHPLDNRQKYYFNLSDTFIVPLISMTKKYCQDINTTDYANVGLC